MSRQVAEARRATIDRHVDVSSATVLEIGALDQPTYTRPEVDVEHLDWFSAEESRAEHRDNPRRRVDHVVEVDHTVKDKAFARHIDRRFDLVVANHVFEHVPDPITWLQQIGLLIVPSGHLVLSVPDRRFTFDYLRPESNITGFLRAYHEDLQRPTFEQIFESLYFWRPVRTDDVAQDGAIVAKLHQARFGTREALEMARARAGSYFDVHCQVFTHGSFSSLWDELDDTALVPWELVELTSVAPGSNEFHVVLQHRESDRTRDVPLTELWRRCR